MRRWTVELDLAGALCLYRALDRECRVLGRCCAEARGCAAIRDDLAGIVADLQREAREVAIPDRPAGYLSQSIHG